MLRNVLLEFSSQPTHHASNNPHGNTGLPKTNRPKVVSQITVMQLINFRSYFALTYQLTKLHQPSTHWKFSPCTLLWQMRIGICRKLNNARDGGWELPLARGDPKGTSLPGFLHQESDTRNVSYPNCRCSKSRSRSSLATRRVADVSTISGQILRTYSLAIS